MSGAVFAGLAVCLVLLPKAFTLTPAQDRRWTSRIVAGSLTFLALYLITS